MAYDAPNISLRLFITAANEVLPGWAPRVCVGKLRFILDCLKLKQTLAEFFARPENAALSRELGAQPKILGFVTWPYVHAGWSVMQRFEALAQHQQAITSDMAALSMAPTESSEIIDMSAVSPGLRLVVDRAPWCLREGSLVFNQFLNDERLMSIAFSFGLRDGERVAYIGSVQGSNVDSALEKYREIAKGLQGMRSRDFLIKAFQLLTFHMGVKRVLCVSEAERHHRHPFFGKSKSEKLHLNYDEIWQEHAGVPTDEGFYRLGSLPAVRAMEDIAAKNRPLYRRRYALMDQLSADLSARYGSGRADANTQLHQTR